MADPGIQHAVHSNREDAQEPQMLGVLGEHGREHAWEGYIPEEQVRKPRLRWRRKAALDNTRTRPVA